jgi:integrase/recombinase XerD
MEQRRQLDHHQIVNNNINEDPNLDRKLDLITEGAHPFLREHLLTRITRENCLTIIAYILVFMQESNPVEQYRVNTIFRLTRLAEYYNPKSFKDMTRQDIIEFLDSLRKPDSVDPLHKWKGNYEITRVVLLRFFRWLYYPNVMPHSKRPKPDVMAGIGKIKRMEESIYKPTDLWTEEDDFIFHKYCPSSRDRCWHAVSRDTGCRPSELLRLKIKDVVAQQLENGYQIARINVNGKTGVRNVRLYNSYPRLKDWLSNGHPYAGNPDTPLFCGIGKKNTGKKLSRHTMHATYAIYKKERFPKLLEDPLVPEEDKRKIRELLKKPWNPYIRIHTAATEISKAVKDPVLIDKIFGWKHSGNTRQKYQHYYAYDGFDAMLVMDGLVLPSAPGTKGSKAKNLLKPKQCPNCDETNKPESKFCVKCRFVLSFDGFNEAIEEKAKAASETEEIKKKIEQLQDVLDNRMKEKAEKEAKELMKTDEMMKRMEQMQADLDKKIKNVEKEKVFKDFLGDIATMVFNAEAPRESTEDFKKLMI